MALPSKDCPLLRHSHCGTSAVGIFSSDWVNFAVAADAADLILRTELGPAGPKPAVLMLWQSSFHNDIHCGSILLKILLNIHCGSIPLRIPLNK